MNSFYVWFLLGYSLVCACIGFVFAKILDCLNKRRKKEKEHVQTK